MKRLEDIKDIQPMPVIPVGGPWECTVWRFGVNWIKDPSDTWPAGWESWCWDARLGVHEGMT